MLDRPAWPVRKRACLQPISRLVLALAAVAGLFGASFAQAAIVGDVRIDGYFDFAYDGEFFQGDDSGDHDLTQTLSVDLARADQDLYHIVFFGTLREDLDGESSQPRGLLVDGLNRERFEVFLYDFYLELHDAGPLVSMKLGRQYGESLIARHFDGAHVELGFAERRVRLFAHGGSPVYVFEPDSGGYFKDWQAGGGLTILPHESNRLTLEYQFVEDTNASLPTYREHMTKLGFWQQIGYSGQLFASASILDDEFHDYQIGFSGDLPGRQLQFHFSWYHMVTEQTMHTLAYSPYSRLLGPLRPYHQIDGGFAKGFGRHVGLDVAFSYRRLVDDNVSEAFNHSYVWESLTLGFYDIGVEGLSLSATVYDWNVLGNAPDHVLTAGGEIGYERHRLVRAAVGSYYTYYKTDYYQDLDERIDVTTVFADLAFWAARNTRLKLRYEFEYFGEIAHQLRLGVTQEF